MKILSTVVLLAFAFSIQAQKKVMEHEDKALWNQIKNVSISNSGDYLLYGLNKDEKDETLFLKDSDGKEIMSYNRTKGGKFTYDSKFAVFSVNAWKDSITEMKRKKVKKKDFPKDTLVIFNIANKEIKKIPNVKSYKIPEKWSGIVAYYLEEITPQKKKSEKEEKPKSKKKKTKKVSSKNGYHLVIRHLENGLEDTLQFVTKHAISKEGKVITYSTTGFKDKIKSGVYKYDVKKRTTNLLFESHNKTTYPQIGISNSGKKIGFVVDADTTKALIKKPSLFAYTLGDEKAKEIVVSEKNASKLLVSADQKLEFSKNEERLFFGLRKPPIVKDTTLIDEEIVNVEVWTYNEPRLYTVQEMQVKKDQKKAYLSLYDFTENKVVQIATEEFDEGKYADEGNSNYAVISNSTPYMLQSQWTGQRPMDMMRVNLSTGEKTMLGKKIYGGNSLSPKGNYLYGYSRKDSTWFTYNLKTLKYKSLTKGKQFYNELHDYPDDPRSYRALGFTENDKELLIYDRYDIWSFNPDTGASKKLTNGRATNTSYRYVKLNDDEKSISTSKNWFLKTFNDETKFSGIAIYNPKKNKVTQIVESGHTYGDFKMAQQDNKNSMLYTRQNFTEFPNYWLTDVNLKSPKQITDANPQQKEYNWGTVEMVEWTSLDGIPLKGMLVKPEDFDPNKKYPMIVNFYEKSSDGLYRYKSPSYGRSTINYPFYASRGYLIFNPDISYRDGYPGESALNCVIPGITALIDKGFVDKDNIGVQGHSWGGYQIAYLVTKTNIFKAAESGAPVPNMISAYGGIRWWTGLSRQFQYEHTQSRIGGTPWEYPQRYIENSPIFNIDKINTPLLIMHNDADGHVPWYQGIEFFVSLRRLGKPSWLLNYNGEPHWPLKMQNRVDFNIRMAQFFDYYLKGAKKPMWMERGVPAIEKGINQGYQLIEEDK
ncbi:alpha/beta hydrolase family protein [Polaribacter sargassicola]|uniref:alpha/beta hydrolase family protein n=1 Tax=Polaribacter sargassicola TaxID=2836891 RepID=UPI001EFF6116|nr:prolyl oligopeptidase family serine peptidase [Polaribacter sp. DS7-9]MCG1036808.1 prolyl oligopeptidase family serine peptidase [Polaribacter sp. DS7-9]